MQTGNPTIRQATVADIPQLKEIFALAHTFMAKTGNPTQWAANYPNDALLRSDIASGDCYVIISDGGIAATFVLHEGADPTYTTIYNGAWLNDEPYAVIHRIASNGKTRGMMHTAMLFAKLHYRNIRIDTHRDNTIMQKAILREGFKYCGIIHCWNGSERLAYQYAEL